MGYGILGNGAGTTITTRLWDLTEDTCMEPPGHGGLESASNFQSDGLSSLLGFFPSFTRHTSSRACTTETTETRHAHTTQNKTGAQPEEADQDLHERIAVCLVLSCLVWTWYTRLLFSSPRQHTSRIRDSGTQNETTGTRDKRQETTRSISLTSQRTKQTRLVRIFRPALRIDTLFRLSRHTAPRQTRPDHPSKQTNGSVLKSELL